MSLSPNLPRGRPPRSKTTSYSRPPTLTASTDGGDSKRPTTPNPTPLKLSVSSSSRPTSVLVSPRQTHERIQVESPSALVLPKKQQSRPQSAMMASPGGRRTKPPPPRTNPPEPPLEVASSADPSLPPALSPAPARRPSPPSSPPSDLAPPPPFDPAPPPPSDAAPPPPLSPLPPPPLSPLPPPPLSPLPPPPLSPLPPPPLSSLPPPSRSSPPLSLPPLSSAPHSSPPSSPTPPPPSDLAPPPPSDPVLPPPASPSFPPAATVSRSEERLQSSFPPPTSSSTSAKQIQIQTQEPKKPAKPAAPPPPSPKAAALTRALSPPPSQNPKGRPVSSLGLTPGVSPRQRPTSTFIPSSKLDSKIEIPKGQHPIVSPRPSRPQPQSSSQYSGPLSAASPPLPVPPPMGQPTTQKGQPPRPVSMMIPTSPNMMSRGTSPKGKVPGDSGRPLLPFLPPSPTPGINASPLITTPISPLPPPIRGTKGQTSAVSDDIRKSQDSQPSLIQFTVSSYGSSNLSNPSKLSNLSNEEGSSKTSSTSPPPTSTDSSSSSSSSSDSVVSRSRSESVEQQKKAARLRVMTIKEVVQTEHSYLASLRTLNEVFIFPIQTLKVLNESESRTLFGNVQEFIPVHQSFAVALETKLNENEERTDLMIGSIFLDFFRSLQLYSKYATNQGKAQKMMTLEYGKRKQFENFLKVCHSDSSCGGLTLDSYLIKPIQRLCKYPLFLRDLIKYTPSFHPDYPLLSQAFDEVSAVVRTVNEEKRTTEKEERMRAIADKFGIKDLLQEGRKLQKEGKLAVKKKENAPPEDRFLILFNDLILVMKPTKEVDDKSLNDQLLFKIVASADLHRTIIIDVSDLPEKKMFWRFEVVFDGKTIEFFAPSFNEKQVWLKEIRQCIKTFQREYAVALKERKEANASEVPREVWGKKESEKKKKSERKSLIRDLSPRGPRRSSIPEKESPKGERGERGERERERGDTSPRKFGSHFASLKNKSTDGRRERKRAEDIFLKESPRG